MNKTQAITVLTLLSLTSACNSNSSSPNPDEPGQPEHIITSKNYKRLDCAQLTSTEVVANFLKDTSLECGLVTLPADWSAAPGGQEIKLAVYSIPSTAEKPTADPIVYLEGGPGDAGVALVPNLISGNASYLRTRSDIVVIDQRGTGFSQPALFCPEVFEAVKNNTDITAAHLTCRNRFINSGVHIADYTSHNNALDISAVRQALGYEQWNLYGLSYGTRLATTVMRDAPKGIRSVILDSVFPVQVNGLSEIPYTYYWAIEQIASNCSNETHCSAKVANPISLIENGIERLSANPLEDLSAADYVEFLGSSIAEPNLMSIVGTVAQGTDQELEALIAEVSEDDDEEDIDLTQIPAALYPFLADAKGMRYSVACAEEYPYLDHKASPDISSHFRQSTQAIINDAERPLNGALCQVWNTPPAGDIETQAISSDIPTLILAGTADISTPPEWGKIAGKTLSKSQYAEFAGLTHGLLGNNTCVNDITLDFFNAPNSIINQTCIQSLPDVVYLVE